MPPYRFCRDGRTVAPGTFGFLGTATVSWGFSMSVSRLFAVSLTCACSTLPCAALADESPWSVGLRAGMSTAGGVPSNDALLMGLAVRYRLAPGRHVGFAADQMDFDFERPWKIVGLQQDTVAEPEDIDGDASTLLLSVFYERLHGDAGARWNPYWSVSLGVASPDTPSVTGPEQGGGTFDVHTDAGTEYVPGVRGGMRWNLGDSWSADFSASVNHHIADWSVVDRQSGATGKVDSYTHYGAQLGFVYRF